MEVFWNIFKQVFFKRNNELTLEKSQGNPRWSIYFVKDYKKS